MPGVLLTNVQAASCFKQTNGVPLQSWFNAQCMSGLKICSESIVRSFCANQILFVGMLYK